MILLDQMCVRALMQCPTIRSAANLSPSLFTTHPANSPNTDFKNGKFYLDHRVTVVFYSVHFLVLLQGAIIFDNHVRAPALVQLEANFSAYFSVLLTCSSHAL